MNADKHIFPAEIIEYTAEYHFQEHHSRSKLIYQCILVFLVAALFSILFIKVDVNVKSAGLFRPVGERNEIKALVAGRVDSVLIKENEHVKQGQVLVTIRKEILEDQNTLVEMQQNDLEKQISDLEKLVMAHKKNDWSKRPVLVSGVYSQQFALFLQRVTEARARFEAIKKNYDRYVVLYKKKAVSAAEFDIIKLNYDNIQNELSLIGEEQGSQWQQDLNSLRMDVRELTTKRDQFETEKEFYTLRSTVSGTIQQLKGVQAGSLVSVNEILGEISPDSGLIAETYVLPKDIGLLKKGTTARFQIDAYDYNQWGMVTGRIISISNDIFMEDGQQPYFKVRCLLDKDELELKNGYKGRIKKGMTLQARFFVTRRTLFQLLYDKADDWLNPNMATPNNSQGKTAAL